jgi:hypothetical protein
MGAPTMSVNEQIEMMQRCASEIRALRATIDVLKPRAEAYDNLVAVLRLLPRPSAVMVEDLAYVLDQRVREITAAINPKAEEKPL